jgi:hypothetical protein
LKTVYLDELKEKLKGEENPIRSIIKEELPVLVKIKIKTRKKARTRELLKKNKKK